MFSWRIHYRVLKIRAMEIIAELEPGVRGAYCGSLFFLGPCGDFDSSILIRTFTLKQTAGYTSRSAAELSRTPTLTSTEKLCTRHLE